MCKIGDIILIDNYISNGIPIKRHSFVVVNDERGQIEGVSYDLICNVMSSLKSEEQKKRKLLYEGNFPVSFEDENMIIGNDKDGYIKADQLYFFNKELTSFRIIGKLTDDCISRLMDFIEGLSQIEPITDNLT